VNNFNCSTRSSSSNSYCTGTPKLGCSSRAWQQTCHQNTKASSWQDSAEFQNFREPDGRWCWTCSKARLLALAKHGGQVNCVIRCVQALADDVPLSALYLEGSFKAGPIVWSKMLRRMSERLSWQQLTEIHVNF
jgi:hypothetical protein